MKHIEDDESLISYTLDEISEWHTKSDQVKIPDIQRGFVWRPLQIETLWESLLRGLPIGSFIFHKTEEGVYDILDGQQRATAIALGVKGNKKIWKMKHESMLWLDLGNEEEPCTFRLITKFHPWGYQRKGNRVNLILGDKQNAYDFFNEKVKVEYDKLLEEDRCWPYDAYLPVPFHHLISFAKEDRSFQGLIEDVKKEYPRLRNKYIESSDDYIEKLENMEKGIEGIKKDIQKVLSIKIPTIIFSPKPQESEFKYSSNIDPDPIEALFVRINSAGTPLAGEELIYSIYKAIEGNLSKIEDLKIEFVKNSKIVALSSLIARANILKEKNKEPSLPGRINVRNFRIWMKEGSDFNAELDIFIKESCEKTFDQGKEILLYDENTNDFGLPNILLSKMAESAHQIFFVLLYRLHNYGEKEFDSIKNDEDLRKRVVGKMTSWFLFGKGKNLKDHRACLVKIWEKIHEEDARKFWSNKGFFLQDEDEIMLTLPSPDCLKKQLQEKRWSTFLSKTKWNRSLLLYGQRRYIESLIESDKWSIETPWDWDHIHPQNKIRGQGFNKEEHKKLKEWHNSIGNLMALDFPTNRSCRDKKTTKKFEEIKEFGLENFFVEESKGDVWDTENNDLKLPNKAKELQEIIQDRYCRIYRHWYETLEIGKLGYTPNDN